MRHSSEAAPSANWKRYYTLPLPTNPEARTHRTHRSASAAARTRKNFIYLYWNSLFESKRVNKLYILTPDVYKLSDAYLANSSEAKRKAVRSEGVVWTRLSGFFGVGAQVGESEKQKQRVPIARESLSVQPRSRPCLNRCRWLEVNAFGVSMREWVTHTHSQQTSGAPCEWKTWWNVLWLVDARGCILRWLALWVFGVDFVLAFERPYKR